MSETSLKSGDLPSTWALTSLGAVVDYGSTTKAEPSQISGEDWVLELEDIEKDSSRLLQRITFAQRKSKSTKSRFQAGDVLYGKLRPYLNKVLIADRAGYCTTEIVPIRTGLHLDNRYLFYWLKHPAFLKYVEAKSHGMNMPRLGTDTAKAAPFVLAPRNEQTRIADQLDKVLARVHACNERIKAIPALLKRFRQAVLDAATSGELTHEWRKASQQGKYDNEGAASRGRELPPGWNWSCAEEIKANEPHSLAIGPFGSNLKVSDYTQSGVPLVFVREIRSKDFSGRRSKFVSSNKAESLSAHSIQGGDLLITKMGDPPGDVAVYPSDAPMAIITADCIKLRVNSDRAIAAFVGYAIEATSTRERLSEITSGVAQQKISLARFRHFPLILPPVDEQAEIVRRVEALFKLADRIEARYITARTQAQGLTPLLLAKAFRGELVPQDLSDEPASVLLERIAAKRATTATQPRRRQSTAGRKPIRAPKENAAMTKSRQDDDVRGKPYLAKHLRLLGGAASAEALFKASELSVADFYKQLAWEVAQGHLLDGKTVLELADAA